MEKSGKLIWNEIFIKNIVLRNLIASWKNQKLSVYKYLLDFNYKHFLFFKLNNMAPVFCVLACKYCVY